MEPRLLVIADALLVDLDGTLYHPMPVKVAVGTALLAGGGVARRTVWRFRREHEHIRRDLVEPVSDPFRLQLQRTARAMQLSVGDVARVVEDWMFLRPLPWLRRCRRRPFIRDLAAFRQGGGRIAVVSDYPARAKLAALGVAELVDVVIACGEPGGPGRLKPWPDGLLAAAERLGVPPSRCLVRGDRADLDGLAAARAGMQFQAVG